jgi:signal peptidase
MKKRTAKKWVSNIISALFWSIFLFLLFMFVYTQNFNVEPQVLGYQFKIVESGSMEPGIKTGSVIAVKAGGDMSRFNKGDIITFKTNENTLITHRIVNVIKKDNLVSYQTKGDNNKTEDLTPVPSENVLAQYEGFTVPVLGYVAEFFHTKSGVAILLFMPGLFIFLFSVISIIRTVTRVEKSCIKTQI